MTKSAGDIIRKRREGFRHGPTVLRSKSRASLTAALLALSACTPQSQGVTFVESFSPGEELASLATAQSLFRSVCVETRGAHRPMVERLTQLPVTYEPASGIFYHDQYDINIKPVRLADREICSFVMGTTDARDRLQIAQQARAAGMVVTSRDNAIGPEDRTYITVQTYAGQG